MVEIFEILPLVDFFRLDLPRWRSPWLPNLDVFQDNLDCFNFHAPSMNGAEGTGKLKARQSTLQKF
jgi:hypothetical protein